MTGVIQGKQTNIKKGTYENMQQWKWKYNENENILDVIEK